MEKLRKLWHKLKTDVELVRYIIIGVLTTAINYGVYLLMSMILVMPQQWYLANGVAWVISVAFAYVANKRYVFGSKTSGLKDLMRELLSFVAMRLVSLGLEYLLMFLLVDQLHVHHLIGKIITNVVVVVSNYAFSKLFIFRVNKNKAAPKTPPNDPIKEETNAS